MSFSWTKLKRSMSLLLRTRKDDDESEGDRASSTVDPEVHSKTSIPSSSGLLFNKSGGRLSKKICAICLGMMKPGNGHAIFTAECSHSFHFNCIASSFKHGNRLCPMCRAKWKDIPFQSPSPSDPLHRRSRVNPLVVEPATSFPDLNPHLSPHRTHYDPTDPYTTLEPEPDSFSDDEPLELTTEPSTELAAVSRSREAMTIETHLEFPAVPASEASDAFTVLVHLRAPCLAFSGESLDRVPIDLVTVLDVSGSMAGTKLALLKRAMGFVVQNLGPTDRLSVVAFSSNARRLFPLTRMSEQGRQRALMAINGLTSCGGTNIVDGLRHAARVLEERTRARNPVCSLVLLSDGQDTYNSVGASPHSSTPSDQILSLLPPCLKRASHEGLANVPVHTFGFGSDHDANCLHSISEASGGTFSFIQAELAIQDAFARCIGGLLSVVLQELRVEVGRASPGVSIASVQAGNYTSTVSDDSGMATVHFGDLYAEEERDFLIQLRLPSLSLPSDEPVGVLKVGCWYKDPVTFAVMRAEGETVSIPRPVSVGPDQRLTCVKVDRQRNRLRAAESIAEAREMAERGDFEGAHEVLARRQAAIRASRAACAGDGLSGLLDVELGRMRDNMATQRVYEQSGRAYALSGLSSHSWQRATTRGGGDSSEGYQTTAMTEMLARSQTLTFASASVSLSAPLPPEGVPRRRLAPTRSCKMPSRRWGG
ncbi:uncharacterized protein LOC18443149 isoform X1 [Amborella trichopoda]|nr:uncharacterized protein LOC18443149 isoform X1 [Amborella trichopoda]|eukprot:XP_006853405.2 uncharacterized protein LOC18443149 isoform X1 [Amborella trichopoda]